MQQALILAVVTSIALLALSVATDEGNVSAALRVARVVPLLPLTSVLALAVTMTRIERRGEGHALEALGVRPSRWRRWIAVAALTPALGGAIALLLGVDRSGLFPTATAARPCTIEADGFHCAQTGVMLAFDGARPILASPTALTSAPTSAWTAALVVASMGLALVTATGLCLARARYWLLVLGMVLAETAVCQTVGAGRAPTNLALMVPFVALAWLGAHYTRVRT